MAFPLKHTLLLFGIITVFARNLNAQTPETDVILEQVELEHDNDEKARLYVQVSELTTATDIHESLNYLKFASDIAVNDELLGNIWDRKGRLYFALNNMDDALLSFQSAKHFKEKVGNITEAASVNNRVGVVLLRQKKHQEALETFLESAAIFELHGDVVNTAMCHNNMSGVFADMGDYENAVRYNELALPVFQQHNIKPYAIITLTNLAGQYLRLQNRERSFEYNKQAEQLALELNDHYALGIVYNNLGQHFFEEGETETALDYYQQALTAKQALGTGSNLVPTLNNLGQAYILLGQSEEAVRYLKQGLASAAGEELWPIYSNLTKAFLNTGLPDSASHYFDLTLSYRDSIFSMERQAVIDELRTQYETERKDIEIQQLEVRQKQNRIVLSGLSALFGATLIIAFLVVKNYNKKRIIAQKNEEIERQYVEQLLKEQELIGINAMLMGQEQEREKIAEELHDSIGNSLATLKLYIESLDSTIETAQFSLLHQKASHLLEHTYDDVRKIAYSKSGGVLINKGLVPAVKAMAKKISESQKISISVMDTGLENRLSSRVEISVFKSIQELLSNAVKHSGSSEVILQLIQHDENLTIMVEDNGNGFHPQKERWGLGFTNIQKRTDQYGGELVIDSSPGNGTTIILNIPTN